MNIAKSLKKNPKQTKQKQKHDKKTKPPNLSGFTYFQLFSDQFSWNIFFLWAEEELRIFWIERWLNSNAFKEKHSLSIWTLFFIPA